VLWVYGWGMGPGIYRTNADYTDTTRRIMRSALRCPGEGLRNRKVLGEAVHGGKGVANRRKL